jgi:cobalt/nickel transport system permease protein
MNLLAVHISDGVLPLPLIVGGFVFAALLVGTGCTRIHESEVPFLALISAVFFVASLIHIRTGPTSVHLLLNGLAGVVLGRRAGPAIAVGLTLQAVLIGHGGFSSLGINVCVMTIPALAAAAIYRWVLQSPIWTHAMGRSVLAAVSASVWTAAALAGALVLLARGESEGLTDTLARWSLEPWTWIGLVAIVLVIVIAERRMATEPIFAVGLLLGTLAALFTVAFHAIVLGFALPARSEPIAAIVFLAHLPIAAIEGWIVGSVLSFLHRAAPHLLDRSSRLIERE